MLQLILICIDTAHFCKNTFFNTYPCKKTYAAMYAIHLWQTRSCDLSSRSLRKQFSASSSVESFVNDRGEHEFSFHSAVAHSSLMPYLRTTERTKLNENPSVLHSSFCTTDWTESPLGNDATFWPSCDPRHCVVFFADASIQRIDKSLHFLTDIRCDSSNTGHLHRSISFEERYICMIHVFFSLITHHWWSLAMI